VVFLRSFPERKRKRWGEEEIVAVARGRKRRGELGFPGGVRGDFKGGGKVRWWSGGVVMLTGTSRPFREGKEDDTRRSSVSSR
jgi:hypothetical protein